MQIPVLQQYLHWFGELWPEGQKRIHDIAGTLATNIRNERQLWRVVDESNMLEPLFHGGRSTKEEPVLLLHKMFDNSTHKMLKHSDTFLDTVIGGPRATACSFEVMRAPTGLEE